MKALNTFLVFVCFILLIACEQKSGESKASDPVDSEPNQLLEKEAWRIHDEVMPKMGTLYKLKGTLQEKLTNSPEMPEAERAELQEIIRELDLAYEGMMQWMRNFKPEQHADNEEKTREYLENEIESIRKVKEDILSALDKGKAAAGQ